MAHRQPGNVNQWSTAKTAIRGEQGGEQTGGDPAGGRYESRDLGTFLRCNPGPGSPDWVPATAEDDPPSPGSCYGGSTGRSLSITARNAGRNEQFGSGRRTIGRTGSADAQETRHPIAAEASAATDGPEEKKRQNMFFDQGPGTRFVTFHAPTVALKLSGKHGASSPSAKQYPFDVL